jgi:hypothetical protein
MRPALASTLLLAALSALPALSSAAPEVSRDGHFSAELPAGYAWLLDQYPPSTHGHIVAAWSVPGPGFKRLEIAVQSLRYMTAQELERPAAASCERWTRLDELRSPCRDLALTPALTLHYTIRSTRTGTDSLTGFFDLGHGLVYCVMTSVPSGNARQPAVAQLGQALSTLAKADAYAPPPAPKCDEGEKAFYENWPKAGDWKCRPAVDADRILAPTDEPFNPYRRVNACPGSLTLARVDEPAPGDLGCVDFVQTTQRLLERFNHTQVFKCEKNERPALFKRDGRKRDFVCERLPKPKAPPADDAQQ